MSDRPGTFESLRRAMMSWRTASVVLLSFSSGLPLGLVWIAIPDWMRTAGVDIRVIGLITLAQAPWTFKMVWSPFMDRYRPPFMGRRRGWAILMQVALFALTLSLAGVGHRPEAPWVVAALAFALALAAASQDIAIDAYAVDVLRREEQGVAVGARIAVYRAAMYIAGGISITVAGMYSWPLVNIGLACLYLPMMLVTWKAPEPPAVDHEPASLREAVWHPFLGFLARDRALQILAFVFFYKFADNLGQALLRPFLVDMGYSDFDRGIALATVGLAATLAGAFIGGAVTTTLGLGHSLWLFGVLQIASNAGYILLARSEVNRPLMYGALGFESLTQGLGTGAFSVLLLRMTQKRFSATQYALFSSLFSMPRILAGPVTGFVVFAVGWEPFFWMTILAGIPGLILLQRFVPLGVREPHFTVRKPVSRRPLSSSQLTTRGVLGGTIGFILMVLITAGLAVLRTVRNAPDVPQGYAGALAGVVLPQAAGDWLTLAGLLLLGVVIGLGTAAVSAARHGAAAGLHAEDDDLSEAD
ncbi:MAG: MFS transporter [Acidobacteria bacterium]|nr:MFS transporter [Acidobacteriota bacterium]